MRLFAKTSRHPFLAALAATFLAVSLQGAAKSSAGVRWVVPPRWKEEPERAMRVATYKIPPAAGAEEAECAVFHFGPGQGGGVEENLARWAKQFEGGPPPKKDEKTIAGLKVHLIDIGGTYLSSGGPMMQSQGKKPGYRLLGAIVEAPGGLVFFKLTGSAASVSAAKPDFDLLIKSLSRAPNV